MSYSINGNEACSLHALFRKCCITNLIFTPKWILYGLANVFTQVLRKLFGLLIIRLKRDFKKKRENQEAIKNALKIWLSKIHFFFENPVEQKYEN